MLPQLLDAGLAARGLRARQDAQHERARRRICDRTTRRSSARSGCRRTSSAARRTDTSRSARSPACSAITLDDVKDVRAQAMYTRANLTLGVSGDAPRRAWCAICRATSEHAAAGTRRAASRSKARRPSRHRGRDPREGHARDGDLVRVSDRRHAGAPRLRRAVGRARLARRASSVERRSCISGFARCAASTTATTPTSRRSRAGCSSSSRTRTSRGSRQLFEIWIRPVVPANAHMSLRIAIYELGEADRERPDAGRLRGDARLPDEERLRDDGAAGPAARLRARLEVVRHRRVHRVHARPAVRR